MTATTAYWDVTTAAIATPSRAPRRKAAYPARPSRAGARTNGPSRRPRRGAPSDYREAEAGRRGEREEELPPAEPPSLCALTACARDDDPRDDDRERRGD